MVWMLLGVGVVITFVWIYFCCQWMHGIRAQLRGVTGEMSEGLDAREARHEADTEAAFAAWRKNLDARIVASKQKS